MVIDKTALLRAIREDYKGQGYMVARRAGSDEDDEGVLVINSSDWLVEIEWKNVPPGSYRPGGPAFEGSALHR